MNNENMSATLHWRDHANRYPNLSHIVKVYLTPRASSVTVEINGQLWNFVFKFKNSQRSAILPDRLNRVRQCAAIDERHIGL